MNPDSSLPDPQPVEKGVLLASDSEKRPWLYLFASPWRVAAFVIVCLLAVMCALLRAQAAEVASQVTDVASDEELRRALSLAKPGSTIRLKPHTYRGGFVIDRSVHLKGMDATDHAIIQNDADTGMEIRSPGVFLEGLQVTTLGSGKTPAVSVFAEGSLDLRNCVITSSRTVGLLVAGKASVTAVATSFSTHRMGFGSQAQSGATLTLSECSFRQNRWGLSAHGGAQVMGRKCEFTQSGMPNGKGAAANAEDPGTQITLEECSFTENAAGVMAFRAGSILAKKCVFKTNGVPPDPGNSTFGVMAAHAKGRLLVVESTFESNLQGISILSGSFAEIADCTFLNNGTATTDPNFRFYSDTVAVGGVGTKAIIKKARIHGAVMNGINVADGASVQLEDSDVTAGDLCGLSAIGVKGDDLTEVIVLGSRCTGNRITGVELSEETITKLTDATLSRQGSHGIHVAGNATVVAESCEINANGGCGVFAALGATAHVFDSTLAANAQGLQAGTGVDTQKSSITLHDSTVTGSTDFGAGAINQSTVILMGSKVTGNRRDIYQAKGGVIYQKDSDSGANR
jgi:hypothetical protein